MAHQETIVDIKAYMGVVYFFLFFCCIGIVVYYAEPGFPWHSYITLVIGYYVSFGIVLLVPIDIAACVIDRRETKHIGEVAYNNYLDNMALLSSAYNVFFTLILIWGSLVLSYEEYYNTDGYFTIMGKFVNSFIRMTRDLVLMVIAAVIVLGILLGQKAVSGTGALLLAVVIVTNAVYQFFLMFLLAYGLVEFPRAIWNESDIEYSLLMTQMKATYDYKEIGDFKINIQEEIAKVKYFKDQMSKGSPSSDLKYAIEVLEADCPEDFKSERKAKFEDTKKYLNKGGQVTVHGLAKLRSDLNVNKDKYKMAQSKVLTTEQRAYLLEDLCDAKKNGKTLIFWSLKNKESSKLEYLWYLVIRPIIYKLLAFFYVMLSLFSFLGVICSMAGVPNETSPYFLAVHTDTSTAAGIVMFIWFSLGYTAYVTLWSLFQIRLSGYQELVPFRTSPESLSFNTRMCLRLAAPLAFFYLGWIAENGLKSGPWVEYTTTNTSFYNYTVLGNATLGTNTTHHSGTITDADTRVMLSAFSRFYNIQAAPLVKNLFGTGFPVILFILVPLFLTNTFNRMFICFGMSSMQFGTAIATDAELAEGKKQLAKFKKIASRAEQRSTLKNHLLNLTKKNKQNSSFFGASFNNTDGETADVEPGKVTISEPEALSGEVEKKVANGSSFSSGGTTYKSFYGEVLKNGKLYFFKDQKASISGISSAMNGPASSEATSLDNASLSKIDLKFITKLKAEGFCLHIESSNSDKVTLRFKSEEELERWRTLLGEWRDYALESEKAGNAELRAVDINKPPPKARPQFGNQFDENMYDLDNIVVGDDTDDTKKSKGWFGFTKKPDEMPNKSNNDNAQVEEKPAKLQGWLEKKGKGKMTSEWQKKYCRVDESSSSLLYSKTKEFDEENIGTIDLREVTNIAVNTKPSKDDFGRFDIDTGDRVYKFKAKTKVDADRWVTQLNLWREYFLLQMN